MRRWQYYRFDISTFCFVISWVCISTLWRTSFSSLSRASQRIPRDWYSSSNFLASSAGLILLFGKLLFLVSTTFRVLSTSWAPFKWLFPPSCPEWNLPSSAYIGASSPLDSTLSVVLVCWWLSLIWLSPPLWSGMELPIICIFCRHVVMSSVSGFIMMGEIFTSLGWCVRIDSNSLSLIRSWGSHYDILECWVQWCWCDCKILRGGKIETNNNAEYKAEYFDSKVMIQSTQKREFKFLCFFCTSSVHVSLFEDYSLHSL